MRATACLGILFLLAAAAGSGAEPADTAGQPSPAAAASALAIIEQQIGKRPPPLEPSGRGPDPGITVISSLFALGSVGCAIWALYPASENWEPEERPNQYVARGIGWGGLQGLLVNSYVAMGFSVLLLPRPDLRADYGSLLDLSGSEREQRAYQILRKRAEQARRHRVASVLLTVGATALPAGAYYLGSVFVDRTPEEKDFGLGYVVGMVIGILPFAVIRLSSRSADEETFASLEARRGRGGQP